MQLKLISSTMIEVLWCRANLFPTNEYYLSQFPLTFSTVHQLPFGLFVCHSSLCSPHIISKIHGPQEPQFILRSPLFMVLHLSRKEIQPSIFIIPLFCIQCPPELLCKQQDAVPKLSEWPNVLCTFAFPPVTHSSHRPMNFEAFPRMQLQKAQMNQLTKKMSALPKYAKMTKCEVLDSLYSLDT